MPLTKKNLWFAIGDLIEEIEHALTKLRMYFHRKGVAEHLKK